MNGKKAKALRKLAESATIGQQDVSYFSGKPPQYEKLYDASTGYVIGYKKLVNGIPMQLMTNCTRFHYKKLKQAARAS